MLHKYVVWFAKTQTWIDLRYPPNPITLRVTTKGVIPPNPDDMRISRQIVGGLLRLSMISSFMLPLAVVCFAEFALPFGDGVDMGFVICTLIVAFWLISREVIRSIRAKK